MANDYLVENPGKFHDYSQFVFDATHGKRGRRIETLEDGMEGEGAMRTSWVMST